MYAQGGTAHAGAMPRLSATNAKHVRACDRSRTRAPRRLRRAISGGTDHRASAAHAAVLQERARIGRELHDSVAQTLYAIVLTTSRARALANQPHSKQLQHAIDDVLRLADTGQSELRALIADIRSETVEPVGLTAGLANLAAEVRARSGLDVRLALADEPRVPATTTHALMLISREALHNVVKHGGAERVDIVLEANTDGVLLQITDDGRGFDPTTPRPGHFGLQSMRERAWGIGGTFALVSADGLGTQVRVRVPTLAQHRARLARAS